jgi:hypothetical protein
MAIVVAGLWHYVDTWLVANLVKGLVAVGFIIPFAVAVYGALLFVLKIEGREELVSLVKRKLVK